MNRTVDFEGRVSKSIEASIAVKQRLLGSAEVVATIAKVSEVLVAALDQGNKVLLFGNGGSAGDAQHIAAEFVGRFAFDRPALPALALSVNTSCVTAIGNDYGFDLVFSRQIQALGRPGDVAIGISTSGNSRNVLQGVSAAHKNGDTYDRFDQSGGWRAQEPGGLLHLRAVERDPPHSGVPHLNRSYHRGTSRRDPVP